MAILAMSVNGVTYDPAPEEPLRSETPRSGFFVITRGVAASWLRFNRNNRSLSNEAAGAQGRDMSMTEWDVNGETLILSRPLKEGELEGVSAGTVVILDGQHRLEACERSGASFVTNISWGIDPATRRSIDSGRARNIRDVLGMDGEKYAGIMGILLRRQVMWENGARKFTGGTKTITNAEMMRVLNADPHGLRRACEIGYRVHARPDGFHLCPASAAAQGAYLTRQIDREASTWFFERLRDGFELTPGHPIAAIRKRFTNDTETRSSGGKRRVASHQPLAYIARGWNSLRAGATLDRIQHPAEQPVPNFK